MNQLMLVALREHLRSSVNVDELQVTSYMIVQLHDATGGGTFQIASLTEDKQLLVGDGYATWAWSVTPLESGQQTLYLSVGTRFKITNDSSEIEFQPLYERKVNVDVDHIYGAKRLLSTNWQWLIATLLVPL